MTLDLISRTGAGGVSVGMIFVFIMSALILLYIGGVAWGGATKADEESEIAEQAASMTEDQFVRIIDISAAHPVVGQAGWLVDRWKNKSGEERRKWVIRNLAELRNLEARTGGHGIESLGVDLPGWLASFDQGDGDQDKPCAQ